MVSHQTARAFVPGVGALDHPALGLQHGFRFGKILRTNSTVVLRELTISGFGISQLALDYVRPDIKNGLLRLVKTDPMPPPLIYSAVYRRDNLSPVLTRIVELAVRSCDFTLRASQ